MNSCPRCGWTPDANELAEKMRATCQERMIWLSVDDRVREGDAAELIGIAPKTMRNWRYGHQPIPFVLRAGRPLYALADIASYLTGSGNSCPEVPGSARDSLDALAAAIDDATSFGARG